MELHKVEHQVKDDNLAGQTKVPECFTCYLADRSRTTAFLTLHSRRVCQGQRPYCTYRIRTCLFQGTTWGWKRSEQMKIAGRYFYRAEKLTNGTNCRRKWYVPLLMPSLKSDRTRRGLYSSSVLPRIISLHRTCFSSKYDALLNITFGIISTLNRIH